MTARDLPADHARAAELIAASMARFFAPPPRIDTAHDDKAPVVHHATPVHARFSCAGAMGSVFNSNMTHLIPAFRILCC